MNSSTLRSAYNSKVAAAQDSCCAVHAAAAAALLTLLLLWCVYDIKRAAPQQTACIAAYAGCSRFTHPVVAEVKLLNEWEALVNPVGNGACRAAAAAGGSNL
jgi:hypothetical protein